MSGVFTTVARTGDIPEKSLRVFLVEGRRVAVSRVEGAFYAIDDVCTHDDGPLGEGVLDGDQVECPRHGARFSVKTGEALTMPAVTPVKVHLARVEGDRVQVALRD